MALIPPNAAKIADLSVRFETMPVETELGPIVWADVAITYAMAGLEPSVVIRVPVPFKTDQTEAQRRTLALRRARQLIDHACQAAGVPAEDAPARMVQDVVEKLVPTALEGVAQELGLAKPTRKPRAG